MVSDRPGTDGEDVIPIADILSKSSIGRAREGQAHNRRCHDMLHDVTL